jgi:hypothetical protein
VLQVKKEMNTMKTHFKRWVFFSALIATLVLALKLHNLPTPQFLATLPQPNLIQLANLR